MQIRLKKAKIEDLERMAVNFNEWQNNKYSAKVKFVYKDGRTFTKDYSTQFRRSYKPNRFIMSVYTVNKKKVDSICEKLSDLEICIATVIDKNSNIICQRKYDE